MSLQITRRSFIRRTALGALGAPFVSRWSLSAAAPVRVRGVVRVGGRPVGGVAVSDGRDVVETNAEGGFELVSAGDRPYVFVSAPGDAVLPVGPNGTIQLYRPILPASTGEATVEFDLARSEQDAERHAFLALADPQTQTREETDMLHAQTVPDVVATVGALGDRPVFGVGCGDLMFDDLSLFPEYERAVSRMGIPFAQVVGNHDLDQSAPTDEGSTVTFAQRFGPTYYSFNVGSVHYVVLDDVFWMGRGYFGYIDDMQLRWLSADLARLAPGSTVVAFLHIPVLGSQHTRRGESQPSPTVSVTNRQALLDLLEPFNAHLVTGHTHELEHGRVGRAYEHVCGAVCGAWWSGPICHDGTPNGYHVFEVDGEDVRWRYKATGEPETYQLRVYPAGSDPQAPEEFVANVWDHTEGWQVAWYVDGERKGAMARRRGFDPESVRLHRGADIPERRPWVEPVPTNHLFYAPAPPEGGVVTVEAVDPWGRTYRSELAI